MAEEVANSSIVVPQSMLTATLINGGLGFGILIAFLFTAGDVSTILKSDVAYPFIKIIENATGSKSAAIVLSSMVSALQVCAGLAGISSGGRMLWSFSREQAIPGWQWISQVFDANKMFDSSFFKLTGRFLIGTQTSSHPNP